MFQNLKTIVVLVILLNLSGCVQKEILDDINLIGGIGFDYSNDEEIIGTILFPVYLPDQAPKNETHSAKSLIKKTILEDIGRQTADPIVTGSMEIVLFGQELASKKGILDLVDAFQRDPGVGSGLYLAIVDGEAKKMLEGDFGKIKDTATHISEIIEHNIKQEDLPKTNLHLFLFDYYQNGKTPFMPQLKQIEKNTVEINGVSLLRHGKIVDFVPANKMFFFKLLVDRYSKGFHHVKLENGTAAIRSIRSQHHFQLTKNNPAEIEINIKVEGIVNEFTGNEDLKPYKIKQIEKIFENEMNEVCLAMVKNFQRKEIDPIGFGHFVKTQTRDFDFKRWQESGYQDLTVKINSKVKITEAGIIE